MLRFEALHPPGHDLLLRVLSRIFRLYSSFMTSRSPGTSCPCSPSSLLFLPQVCLEQVAHALLRSWLFHYPLLWRYAYIACVLKKAVSKLGC